MKTHGHLSNPYPTSQLMQRGYTLLELMISTALGVVIMAGVVQMYASSRTAENAVTGTARVQENVRYLFNRLEEDIGRTGLFGCLPLRHLLDDGDGNVSNIISLLGKDSGSGDPFDFFQPANGLEGGSGSGPGFTDQLSLRYLSPVGVPIDNTYAQRIPKTEGTIFVDQTHPLYSTFKQWQIAILSDCKKALIFMITNDPQDAGSLGTISLVPGSVAPAGSNNAGQFNNDCKIAARSGTATCPTFGEDKYFTGDTPAKPADPLPAVVYSSITAGTRVYKVETSDAGKALSKVCSSANPQYCALTVNGEELVDGVEDFQVQFGEQRGGALNNLAYLDSDDVVEWEDVRSVRVTITLNSVDKAGMLGASGLVQKTFTRTFNMYNDLSSSD